MTNLNVIFDEQKKIIDLIKKNNFKSFKIKNYSLKKIKLKKEEIIKYFDCDFGLRLISFINEIDADHPDLLRIFDGNLTNNIENSFIKQLEEVVKLIKFANKNKISKSIIEKLKINLLSHCCFRNLDLCINAPSANSNHVRFLLSKKQKIEIRLRKKHQIIKIKNINDFTPDNFIDFFRDVQFDNIDSKKNVLIKQNFKFHGLKHLSDHTDISFKKSKNDDYFGFKKINLYLVGLILLKQMIKIFINKTQEEICVTAYPFHEVEKFAGDQTKEIIDYLDNFPDIGYRSLFDHFRVVVCSPKTNIFDFDLMQKKQTISVLLGDRDGEHFFISYFL